MDFYGEDLDYIHLKFGDMRKSYNFTTEFREKHPNFCAEYEKYWRGEPSKFKSALEIVNYVDYWSVPLHFYFNYTDKPAENNREVQEYLINEVLPKDYAVFSTDSYSGWDGEAHKADQNLNWEVYDRVYHVLKRLGFKVDGIGGDAPGGGLEEQFAHPNGYRVHLTQYGEDEESKV